jgi:arginine deiminase
VKENIEAEAETSHQLIQQMLENAKLEIKELERLSANVVKPNDPEMRFFSKTVLKPAQFNSCNLYKFVQKTLMLDVGGLY